MIMLEKLIVNNYLTTLTQTEEAYGNNSQQLHQFFGEVSLIKVDDNIGQQNRQGNIRVSQSSMVSSDEEDEGEFPNNDESSQFTKSHDHQNYDVSQD